MKKDPAKILEGILEHIVEVGTRSHFDWSGIPKGGCGSPRMVFEGNYSVLLIATKKDGKKEQQYEGIVLPDSIGHLIEVYQSEQTTQVPARIQLHDKDIDRWYR